jgi:integrase
MTSQERSEKKQNLRRRGQGEGSIYQRKDGRYVGSFRQENGKRKYVYGETKAQAREKLRVTMHEYKQGTLVVGSNQTLKQFLDQWLQAKRMELKDGTYRYYQSYVEQHIVPALGHLKLQKVNDAHIQSFYTALLEKKTPKNQNLSPNTVRLIHSILSEAFDAAVRTKKVATNPCTLVTPPRQSKKELHYLTSEQALHLLEVARSKQHRLECLLTLALTTGMRQGELLALHWSDIDFAKGTVHVARSLAYHHNLNTQGAQHEYKEAEPKTANSRRTIPLPEIAIRALQAHRLKQVEERLQASTWKHHDLVFTNQFGGYLNQSILRRQVNQLLHEAGLPDLRFHDLRHSAATILISLGVNSKVVQERLGHSNISITLGVYGHVTESMQTDAMKKLDDAFSRPPKKG